MSGPPRTASPTPARQLKRPLCVGLVVDGELAFVEKERACLAQLEEDGLVKVVELDLSGVGDDWQLIAVVNSFLSRQDLDVIHFACHAEFEPQNPRDSYLRLRTRVYRLRYLDNSPAVRFHDPVIFLNACSTGIRRPLETFDFVSSFWKKGARNVVGVESSVESRIAEDFATAFYERFARGMPLGKAVFEGRQSLIEQGTGTSDLMGLFYAVYGEAGCRVEAETRDEALG